MKRKVGRPRLVDDDDDDDLEDLPAPVGSVKKPAAWDCPAIAKQVQAVLDAVEAPQIDRETRLTLQRYLLPPQQIRRDVPGRLRGRWPRLPHPVALPVAQRAITMPWLSVPRAWLRAALTKITHWRRINPCRRSC